MRNESATQSKWSTAFWSWLQWQVMRVWITSISFSTALQDRKAPLSWKSKIRAVEGIDFGEWVQRPDSYWALRIPAPSECSRGDTYRGKWAR